MAWPCISRVCCLARFWNQFDKSDLSVPLTIQNYSDITDQEVRSVTKQVATDLNPRNNYSTPDHRELPHASGEGPQGGSFRGRREPSFKPREDYKPPGVPFQSVTQYKQDFKPWPIPRKDNFPWISKEESRADSGSDSPDNTYQASLPRGEREVRGRGPSWGEQQGTATSKTSANRQEHRTWTGAKPAKSSRTAPYISPEAEASHLHPETSYQAAYRGEAHRCSGTREQCTPGPPASVTQPTPAPPLAGGVPCSSSLQHISLPERNSVPPNKAEDHLDKTKFPPNPSAVFQGGSRVFNI